MRADMVIDLGDDPLHLFRVRPAVLCLVAQRPEIVQEVVFARGRRAWPCAEVLACLGTGSAAFNAVQLAHLFTRNCAGVYSPCRLTVDVRCLWRNRRSCSNG